MPTIQFKKLKLPKKWMMISFNALLGVILIAVALMSICFGKYPVAPKDSLQIIIAKLFGGTGAWAPMTEKVVMGLRLPRIFAAIIVGGSLSLSGATYQGIFRNPLISPSFLGISSGATVGAATAILMGLPSAYIQFFAFLGGLLAIGITILIPTIIRSQSNIMLVLSGIIVGGAMTSAMGLLKYLADPERELAAIVYWQMGSLTYIKFPTVLSVLPAIVVSGIMLLAMSWWINVISMGEREAQSLGANFRGIRNLAILCATLLTASSVCIAGTIGWIGLVIPHFARMMVGPDNTALFPASFLVGGIFLLVVDTFARTVGAAELPLSILTGSIGAPFYAWLLYKQRMRLN